MLWYSALVRWRHNRRPRNYRFIQWGWKTDPKKRHFSNEFRKTLWQDFHWVIEDYFSLLLLRFRRHAFFDRSAALRCRTLPQMHKLSQTYCIHQLDQQNDQRVATRPCVDNPSLRSLHFLSCWQGSCQHKYLRIVHIKISCMRNHGSDAYTIRKMQDSVSTHLKLHMRQTITEGTKVLWKESVRCLRTIFHYFAESFDCGKDAFNMSFIFLFHWYPFPNFRAHNFSSTWVQCMHLLKSWCDRCVE